ncbi:MAG: bifunctional (p)ppGpp synthetase/guanosine-3',5'-bis(diphosphate) 3'-pyrophosphohydrolase [Erysipelotrichaceae bacterium]|nr:bifunctional (p)ppGpp synthetase/guanosine-3',5'-bis(diphosphate) 3'-pyrophosphohydrolase [Erysipelotrichaceae bacterium]
MEEKKNIPINGGYPLHTFEEVEAIYQNYISSPEDRKQIRAAYDFILEKHKDQYRKSGEPYYHHLVEVAYIVASLQAGPATIISAFLHDVVEDTDVEVEDIEKRWGSEVAKIVDALTKIQRLKLSKLDAAEFEAEDHRKILIGMAKDIRVIIIKLADRLHNLRTLGALSPERQNAISKETMDVFVPIAHRLGLDRVKSEMEDLCLKYLEPEKFSEITKLLSHKAKTMGKSLDSIRKRIADILFENNIHFEIEARVKSIYSIYAKMYMKGHPFDEIYDILALRIITDTAMRCYEILGLIHKTYTPVPGRFKDYIAMPKPNMYQSLHTTIVSGNGNFYEIQIRTKEMDEVAEVGVAAHWAYKENSGYNSRREQQEIEDKLHWFRDFVSATNESAESADFSNISRDIFEANVYVFTPKGKVIELPNGSTPIDFAYRIHTKVGDSTTGALVNGVLVPLNTVLKTGDMVEIKTSKNSPGPSEGWLSFVRSAQAKNCIRKFIAKKNADVLRIEKIAKGRQSCLDAFKDRGIDEPDMMELIDSPKVLNYFHFDNIEDLFIGVTNRKPIPAAILEFLKIKKQVSLNVLGGQKRIAPSNTPVYCRGGGSRLAISLANCCTPIPGDDIVGYITKGKGISVHRKTCPNVAKEENRLINVYWRSDIETSTYPVDVYIEANDRPSLLVDILSTLSVAKVSASSLHASTNNTNFVVTITCTLMVSDAKRLSDIFNIVQNVPGVFRVTRMIH